MLLITWPTYGEYSHDHSGASSTDMMFPTQLPDQIQDFYTDQYDESATTPCSNSCAASLSSRSSCSFWTTSSCTSTHHLLHSFYKTDHKTTQPVLQNEPLVGQYNTGPEAGP